MMTAPNRSFTLAGIVLLAGLAASIATPTPASAQPGSDRPGPDRAGERGPMGAEQPPGREMAPPLDRDGLREFITRRLSEIDRTRDRLREGLAALERGDEPSTVARSMREMLRDASPRANRQDGRREDGRRDDARPGEGPGGQRPDGPRPDNSGANPASAPSAMSELVPPLGMGPRLSDEDRKRVRAFIAEHNPEIIVKIDELAGANPRAADRLVDGLGNRLKGLEGLRERDPEEFKLRIDELKNTIEIMKRSRAVIEAQRKSAPDADLAAAKASLREVMDQQFDVRVAMQRKQIDAVRQRLEKLQSELDGASTNRVKTVDEKMDLLLKAMERGPGGDKGPGPRSIRPAPRPDADDPMAPPPPPPPADR